MFDVEEGLRMGLEHGFLLVQVLDTDGEDGAVRRSLVTEALDVGLAERPLPREPLAADEPGAVVVACTLGDVRELHRHLGCLFGRRRHAARTYCEPPTSAATSPAPPGRFGC